MFKDMVREFTEDELPSKALDLDEKGEFQFDLLKRTTGLGLIGIINSREYGGSNMGHLSRMIMIEEIPRVYPSLGFCFQTGQVGMCGLEKSGSEAQKGKCLPAFRKAEKVMAWAVT